MSYAARNAELVRLHVVDGLSQNQIAKRYGLTRERVRQICHRDFGPSLTRQRQAAATAARELAKEARRAERRAYRDSLQWIRDRSEVDENGCWIWQRSIYPTGYGHVGINRAGGYAHRLAWEIANGRPIPTTGPRLCVCHKCDVPSCVNPEHLFLGTHKDNVRDSMLKGRRPMRMERAA